MRNVRKFGNCKVLAMIALSFFLQFTPAEGKEDWKGKWETTLKAAKQEGKVTVFAWRRETHVNALAEFRKFYPDIKLVLIPGSGSRLGPRLVAERRARKFLTDLYIGGTTTPTRVLLPSGALDPIRPALILPEVVDESLWFNKRFYFADEKGEYVLLNDGTVSTGFIAYNTKLVKPADLKSYKDLLDPKWKGKMVAYDPRRRGGSGGPMRFLYYSPDLGPDFVYKLFSKMGITLGTDSRLLMDWLATGKYQLLLFPGGTDFNKAKQQGLPVDKITHLTGEGVAMHAGAGAVSLVNRAPHPNAAKVFINWFLSREGQMAYQKVTGRNSLRTDIPKDGLPDPGIVPKEGKKYIFSALPEYRDLRPIQKLVRKALRETGKK